MALNSTQALDPGVVAILIDAATATGTAKSQQFGLAPCGCSERWLEYHMAGTFTVMTADLEASQDGGTTWAVRQAAIDLFANPGGRIALNPGIEYRFNVKTFTGTSATMRGTVS